MRSAHAPFEDLAGGGDWRPCGVVSLTTDFGLADGYAGTLHGVLHAHAPALRVVDLTHAVAAQDVAGAAFHLRHAWPYFPPGTVHVAVVDPGVGSDRPILAALHAGHLFLAPDNGLLALALGRAELERAIEAGRVRAVDLASYPGRSATFHGRDVFAPLAAKLASASGGGAESWREVGPLASGAVLRERSTARASAGARGARLVHATVVHVDRFGNLITDWEPAAGEYEPGQWRATLGSREVACVRTYSDARPGELVALLDSFGRLEIAVRDGDAARELRLAAGAEVRFESTAKSHGHTTS